MAAAQNVSVELVAQSPIRIIKGKFDLAANVQNNVVLPNGLLTNPNSVVYCSYATDNRASPAVLSYNVVVNNSTTSNTFSVLFSGNPVAGNRMQFIIFG